MAAAGREYGGLLVVHGTADYNASISEPEGLVNALMAHDVEFDYVAYPVRRHGWIAGRDFVRRAEVFLARHPEPGPR